MNPWDRLPTETSKAFEAFSAYCEMGPERSLTALAQKLHKTRTHFGLWSRRHSWVERATLYDAHMQGIEQRAAEKAVASEAAKWARRQVEQRERDWAMADQLREKAERMLTYPLSRQSVRDKDGVTIVEPARWTMADAVRMAETAAKLARLAAEMATDRRQLDVAALSDAELERIIEG
jgi:hypothetical protein